MAENRTKVTVWSVGDLVNSVDTGELTVPEFQRSLVWSDAKKKDLIASLIAGHPVGVILVSQGPPKSLIDGLQRTQAISAFRREPLSFISAADMMEDYLRKLRKKIASEAGLELTFETLVTAVDQWMAETGTTDHHDGFESFPLSLKIVEQLGAEGGVPASLESAQQSQLIALLANFIDHIRSLVDIDGQVLPVLEFTGSNGELAEVFEKLNSKGTPLNRFDILGASWLSTNVTVTNADVLEQILAKEQDLEEAGFTFTRYEHPQPVAGPDDFEEFNEEVPESAVRNLHEYLTGLGRLLAHPTKGYPLLFRPMGEGGVTPSLGFNLAAIAHHMKLFPDISPLPTKMSSSVDGNGNVFVDPSAFEHAVLASAKFVSDVLSPFLGLKLNKAGQGLTEVVHTEYQAISLVARVMLAGYHPETWDLRSDAEQRLQVLALSIPQHYLRDVLEGVWQGAGDSTLFRRVWATDDDGVVTGPSPYYEQAVTRGDLEETLERWHKNGELARLVKKRAPVRSIQKLVLRFVYVGIVNVLDEATVKFEIEHLFPVKRLSKLTVDGTEGWPIGAISNLALFDKKTNRAKSALTVSEYLESLEPSTKEAETTRLEPFLLVPVDSVAIPSGEGPLGPGDRVDLLTLESYLAFLETRFQKMKGEVLKNVKAVD